MNYHRTRKTCTEYTNLYMVTTIKIRIVMLQSIDTEKLSNEEIPREDIQISLRREK